MRAEEEDPLPVDVWLSELTKLEKSCSQEPADAEERCVRRAFHLAVLAPPPVRRMVAPAFTESELELLLEQGRLQDAALRIVGKNSVVDLSHSDVRRPCATLAIDGASPVSCCAATPGQALIGAWARFLTKSPGA